MSQYNVKGYDLRDIQHVMLDILLVIDRICAENGLRYTLYGGTVLGAIRHKGFIPWDDDADIAMPREDYDRFIKIASESMPEGYCFQCMENTPKYPYSFGKVFASNTLFTEKGTAHLPICHGVYVDVFPFDDIREKDFLFHARMVSHYSNVRYYKLKMIHERKYLPFSLAPLRVINGLADRHMKYCRRNADKVCNLCFYRYGMAVWTWEEMFDTVRVPFETAELCVPARYDRYLTDKYGDYMQYPPLEKQKPMHNIIEVRL